MERVRGAHCSALSSAYSALQLTEAFAPPFSLFTNTSCVQLPLCFPVTFLPGASSHQALSEHPSAQTKSMLELRKDSGAQGKYLWGLWFCSIQRVWGHICNLTVDHRQWLAPGSPVVMGWALGSLPQLGRVSKGAKEVSVHKDGQELPWARPAIRTQIYWLYPLLTGGRSRGIELNLQLKQNHEKDVVLWIFGSYVKIFIADVVGVLQMLSVLYACSCRLQRGLDSDV